MDDRGLPADHLGDEAVDQDVVVAQLAMLVGIKAERQNRAGHGVAGRCSETLNRASGLA
jgi:hypothetical protein